MVAMLLVDPGLANGQQTAVELDQYRVKAAFVYRFPQFVDWPPEVLAAAPTLDVCVLRPNPFGADLEELTRGETVNGRMLRVREIAGPINLEGCHVVFIGSGAAPGAVLKAAAGRPILTVGETERFLDEGGIIALKIVDRRVRFEVHDERARQSGLRISAQLLNLAMSVRRGPS
jgi:hypothetical protein